MGRFNISGVARGLTTYAIERQNGWERHQPEGAPPWQAQRRLWTDAILQGMARLEEQVPDPKLMEQFDRELEQASGSAAAVPAPLQLQRGTIQNLRNFVTALEDTGDDRRRQINVVRELLEDMASHLPWAGKSNRLDLARDEAERSLVRMTAQMPIRFTHIALGGDAGPYWASGFVSGSVTDAETVKQSAVYQGALRDHPEITNWATLCVVYVGRGLPSALGTVDASDFDLEIMNRTGDRFLDERGVRWLSGPYQMTMRGTPRRSPPSRPWSVSAPTAMWSTASARCTPGALGQSRMTLRRRSGSPRRQRMVTSTPNILSPGSTAGAGEYRRMMERRWSCILLPRRRSSPTLPGSWESDTVTGSAALRTDGRPPGISPRPMTDSGRWRISAPMTGSSTASAGCYSVA